MTHKEIRDNRKWTPKLVGYTLTGQAITGLVIGGLCYFGSLWMNTVTTGLETVTKMVQTSQVTTASFESKVTEQVNAHEVRLARVEKKIWPD